MSLIDSYSDGGNAQFLGKLAGNTIKRGQSFNCSGVVVLNSVKVSLRKYGSPTGNIYIRIYAHSGSYGSSSIPTGSVLATSDPVSASSLSAYPTYSDNTFTFSGSNKITLEETRYCFLVDATDTTTDGSNYIQTEADGTAPTHGGNSFYSEFETPNTFVASSVFDQKFYVYAEGPPTVYTTPTATKKSYLFKVYNINGKYITTWNDASFGGFSKYINGGLGECEVKLARQFDDFGEGYDVKFANEVQIWVADGDSGSTGVKVYSGFISRYEPFIDGTSEGVSVKLLGYVNHLAKYPLRSFSDAPGLNPGDEPYTWMSFISTDPVYAGSNGGMAESIMAAYTYYSFAKQSAGVKYNNHRVSSSSTSLEKSNTTCSYYFNNMSVLEALDKCRQLVPANWWYYIGADNLLQFKPKPNKATHRFIFGKDFKSVKVQKNIEGMVNYIRFWNGLQTTDAGYLKNFYNDTTSQESYYLWMEQKVDGRITVDGTADSICNSTLDEKDTPSIKTIIEVIDNNGGTGGYDIESINPGDTCTLMGFNDVTSNTFEKNMTITQVDYTLDKVTITLSNKQEEVGRQIAKINSTLDDVRMEDAP